MSSVILIAGATSSAMKSRGGLKVERLSAIASGVAVIMGLTIACGGSFGLPTFAHSH